MAATLGYASITVVDLNDAIRSGTAPSSPSVGTLWIDNSVEPNVLKQWNGSSWIPQSLSLETLDPSKNEQLVDTVKKLVDYADDSKLTVLEKKSLKERLNNITGVALTNTSTLPTASAIETSAKGEVYFVRLEARNAGVATTSAEYIDVATKYEALRTMLSTVTPKPWDISVDTTVNITATTWEATWNGYYSAVAKLRTVIANKLKSNIDGNDTKIRDDLNLEAPLPTNVRLDGDGITATTTSNADAYARLDYRGLYIKNGAIQIDGGLAADQINSTSTSKWDKAETSVQQGTTYNGIRIDTVNGLVVTKSDNRAKTTLNATEGIKIETSTNGTTWTKAFYAGTDGKLYATGLVIDGTSTVGGTAASTVVSNAKNGSDTVNSWKMSGKTTIDGGKIEADSITAAKIKAGSLEIGNFTTEVQGKINAGSQASSDLATFITSTNVKFEATDKAIQGKVSSETLELATGKNQWLLKAYTKGNTTKIAPAFSDLVGKPLVKNDVVSDAIKPFNNVGDGLIIHISTNVYVTAAKNLALSILHDDGARIYVNGKSVYEQANTVNTTRVSVTLPLIAGWNSIDVLVDEITGNDFVDFGVALSTQVDAMNYQKAGSSDARQTYTESIVKQTADTVSTTVERIDGMKIGGGNMVYNSDATIKADNGSTDGWQSNVTTEVFDGKNSIKISNANSAENFVATNRFAVDGATQYTIRVLAKYETNLKGFDVYFLGRSAGNTTNYEYTHLVATADKGATGNTVGQYKEFIGTFTTEANEREGYIRLDNNGTNNTSPAVIYYAEVQMEKGNIATAYSSSMKDSATRVARAEQKITPDAIINTVSSTIKGAVDGVQVGGRNYLKNSRLIIPRSNNNVSYPISYSTQSEGEYQFYRIKRSSIDLPSTTMSLYNTIPATDFNYKELAGKTVTISMKVRASQVIDSTIYSGAYSPNMNFSKHNAKVTIGTEWKVISDTIENFPLLTDSNGIRFTPMSMEISKDIMADFYLDVREWQIEIGNKVTDWQEAMEDQKKYVDDSLVPVLDRVDKAEQKITSTAIINTVSSTIDNKVQAGVDGIQVGGRNLLFGTAKTFADSMTGNSFIPPRGDLQRAFTRDGEGLLLETGQTYTIQFEYEITNYVVGAGFGLGSGLKIGEYDNDTFVSMSSYENYGGAKGKVVRTFTYTSTDKRYMAFRPLRIASGNTGTMSISISKLQVEKGNKATDWDVSPEDQAKNASLGGSVLTFSDNGGAVVLPSLKEFNNFTIEAYVYYRGGAGNSGIFGRGSNTTHIEIQPGGNLRSKFNNGELISIGAIPENQWTHIAIVVSVSTQKIFHCVNGKTIKQITTTGMENLKLNSNPVHIGESLGSYVVADGARGFNGYLTEIRIWDSARSEAQVASNMANVLIGNETNLYAYYRLNGGAKAYDLVGGRDGELKGSAMWAPASVSLVDVATRVYNAEQKITADAITSTVTSSTTYKNDVQATIDKSTSVGWATPNGLFSNWYTSSSGVPYPIGMSSWSTAPTKEITNSRVGTGALRWNVGENVDAGVTINADYFLGNIPNSKYYFMEIDFMLVSGSLDGAAVLLDWNGMTPYRAQINLKDYATGEPGKWSTIRAVMKRPTDTLTGYNRMVGYMLVNWSNAGARKAKDIIIDRLMWREATQEEVTAFELNKTTVPQLATRVQQAEEKITPEAIVNTVTSSTTYTNNVKNAIDSSLNNMEIGGTNLLPNADFSRQYTNGATAANPDLYATDWGGYNGGVTNPTTSWHAHVDTDTFGYPVYEYNEADGNRGWKAMAVDIIKTATEPGTYTLSADLYATGAGTKLYGGFYYYKVGGTTRTFHDGQVDLRPTSVGKWDRYSVQVTLGSEVDYSRELRFYFYGYGFTSNSIMYMKRPQLEKGNKATAWGLSPMDAQKLANTQAGIDKWLFEKYDKGSYAQTEWPTYSYIAGKTPTDSYLVDDGADLIKTIADNYIGLLRTGVYVETARTISFKYSGDDASRLYLNGTSVHAMGTGTSGTLNLPLKQGWNTLEFIWIEGTGADGIFSIDKPIAKQVDIMSCYQAKTDGQLTNIASRVSTAETKMTDSSIISTVRTSTEYTNDRNSDLNAAKNYASSMNTQQLIKNSTWRNGRDSWMDWASGWDVDTGNRFEGESTAKVVLSGLTANAWRQITSNRVPAEPGQKVTISVWVWSDNISSIDQGSSIEINYFSDLTSARLGALSGSNITPSVNNTWQQRTVTFTVPNVANLKYIAARFHPVRNGRIWIGKPMMQFGEVATPHQFYSETDTLEKRVVTTESKISQLPDDVTILVKNNDISNQINLNTQGATIQANKINLVGAVTISALDSTTKGVLVNGDSSIINPNPHFLDWTGTYPVGYASHSTTAPTKVSSGNGTGNALKWTLSAGTNGYLNPNQVTNMPFFQYITVEATFMLESGTLPGAGVLFRYNGTGNTDHHIRFDQLVSSPTLGKWYTVSKTIKQATQPTGFSAYSIFPMGGWSGFTTVAAKTIQFDSVITRPATDQEINAYETGSTVSANSANWTNSWSRVSSWTASGKTTINGGMIETNTILAKQIGVGDFSNIVSGSDFEDAAAVPWTLVSGMDIDNSQYYTGTKSLKITKSGSANLSNKVYAQAGDEFYVEFYTKATTDWNGTNDNAKLRFADSSNNLLSQVEYGKYTNWTKVSKIIKVTKSTMLQLSLNSNGTVGSLWIDDIIVRRRYGGELIVDGSITTDKISANGISADVITGGTINGITINGSVIRSEQIEIETGTAYGNVTNTESTVIEDGSILSRYQSMWKRSDGKPEGRENSVYIRNGTISVDRSEYQGSDIVAYISSSIDIEPDLIRLYGDDGILSFLSTVSSETSLSRQWGDGNGSTSINLRKDAIELENDKIWLGLSSTAITNKGRIDVAGSTARFGVGTDDYLAVSKGSHQFYAGNTRRMILDGSKLEIGVPVTGVSELHFSHADHVWFNQYGNLETNPSIKNTATWRIRNWESSDLITMPIGQKGYGSSSTYAISLYPGGYPDKLEVLNLANANIGLRNGDSVLKIIGNGTQIQARNAADTGYIPYTASAFNTGSLREFKAYIEDTKINALEEISKLRAREYYLKSDLQQIENNEAVSSVLPQFSKAKKNLGFIWEEVENEMLKGEESLSLYDLTTLGLKGIQELIEKYVELSKEIEKLKEKQ